MLDVVITQMNTIYHVEMPDHKVYCLNKNSLKWNLKHILKLKSHDITAIMCNLDKLGHCTVHIAA